MDSCATAWHLLSNYTDLSLLLKTEAIKDFFLDILTHFLQIAIVNVHALQDSETDEPYGAGFFTLGSLMNHSCAPNLNGFLIDHTEVFVVERTIKAGEQLFRSYNANRHLFKVKAERQTQLKSLFYFDCECEACVNNYPLLDDMSDPPAALYQKILDEFLRLCDETDKVYAKKTLLKVKRYLKQNDKNYPSVAVCQREAIMVRCFSVLMDDKPLKELLKPLKKWVVL